MLASVAFDAGIINERLYERLYTMLMLALITSVVAGSWLEAVLKRGRALVSEDLQPHQLAEPRTRRQAG